jgi:preprotein translocase subunit YajC
MTGIAYAAEQGAKAASAGGFGQLASFAPLVLIFIVFYFLLIRPQQKQAKKHQEYLNNLKVGNRVITKGGIHGQITGLTDTIVTIEIDKDIRVKVSRDAINMGAEAAPATKEKKKAGQ